MSSEEIKLALSKHVLDEYITIDELAEQIHRSKRTIHRLHAMRKGPPRVKVGRLILYKLDLVKEWLASNTEAIPENVRSSLDIKKALLLRRKILTRK